MPDDRKTFAKQITQKTYEEVWNEFYEWEEEYCKQALASLSPSSSSINSSERSADTNVNLHSSSQSPKAIHVSRSKPSKERYEFITYYDGWQGPSIVQQCPVSYQCRTTDPFPPYEACTYSLKNIYFGDDCDVLPFMPFSDRPDFPYVEYLEHYAETGWDEAKDPDLDVILAEVVRRLHFNHGLSFQEIDETQCLPTLIIEQKNTAGLLQILKERDLLDWPGAKSDLPPLPRSDQPPPTSLRRRVNGIHYVFCPNLNCLEPYCPTHLTLDGGVRPRYSISFNGDCDETNPPCGTNCYKIQLITQDLLWDDASIDDLKFILEGAANLSSCDLAVVCDRPCYEVYHQRQKFITPNSPQSNDDADKDRDSSNSNGLRGGSDYTSSDEEEEKKPKFVDVLRPTSGGSVSTDVIPPFETCRHTGKCSATNNCVCYRKSLHCHRNCSCDRTCIRRPKGCKCRKSFCQTRNCPCYRTGRECDPELCITCEANDVDSAKCRNNGLQYGRRKAVEIKEGAFGLGLFLAEPAKEGDLIGEYVGEIISQEMTESRGVLSRYLGRNYLFALNSAYTIDAAFVGNETRFINHAASNQANCRAEVREVNGDHRIGVYVVKKLIQPGEELFMDYGNEYFVSSTTNGTPRVGGTSTPTEAQP